MRRLRRRQPRGWSRRRWRRWRRKWRRRWWRDARRMWRRWRQRRRWGGGGRRRWWMRRRRRRRRRRCIGKERPPKADWRALMASIVPRSAHHQKDQQSDACDAEERPRPRSSAAPCKRRRSTSLVTVVQVRLRVVERGRRGGRCRVLHIVELELKQLSRLVWRRHRLVERRTHRGKHEPTTVARRVRGRARSDRRPSSTTRWRPFL